MNSAARATCAPGRGSVQGRECRPCETETVHQPVVGRGGTRPRRCGARSGRACAGPAGSRSPAGPSSTPRRPRSRPARAHGRPPSRRPRARGPRPAAGPARTRCTARAAVPGCTTSCVGPESGALGLCDGHPAPTLPAACRRTSMRFRGLRSGSTTDERSSDCELHRDVHPRRRDRARAGRGDRARARGDRRRIRVGLAGRGRGRLRAGGHADARSRAGVDPAQQGRDEGPDHDAGRVRASAP